MDGWPIMAQAAELAQRGEPFALATVVWRQGPSSGQQGSRAIITASGEVRGWIGGACAEPSVIRQAREVIAEGTPRLLLLGTTDKFGDAIPDGMTVVPIACQSEGALEVYIEPVLPSPHLVVVGRSPMARTLAEMAAALGWRTDLRDWTEFSASDATRGSMVVVATQGHGDEEAVEQAVAARPAYLGLVGSRKRGAAVLGYLADRGVAREELDRVRVPAGLDLGRTSHPEIAVAILAELVQLRSAGQLGPQDRMTLPRQPRGPRPARPAAAGSAPAEATDPVCGMTVATGKAGRPLQFGGVDLLLLQRRLPGRVRVRSRLLRQERDAMLITNDFEVAKPVAAVWDFFGDIPRVATCLPGAELTETLGDDKYGGRVAVRMGPVKLQFAGTAEITERDEAAKKLVVHAAGAEERGRGQASMVVSATLTSARAAAPRSPSARTCSWPALRRSTAVA